MRLIIGGVGVRIVRHGLRDGSERLHVVTGKMPHPDERFNDVLVVLFHLPTQQ